MTTNKYASKMGYISVSGEDELLKKLDNFRLTRKEKSAIVESAMPIVEKHLYDNTPYLKDEDVQNKRLYGKQIGHLRDHITYKPNQFPNGSTEIGFQQKAYPIAYWTDWGTYRQPGQFWFEHMADTMPYEQIFTAQTQTASKIISMKGLGGR